MNTDLPSSSTTSGVLPNIAGAALQGPTFGFSDEIIGAARGALTPGMTMAQGVDAEQRGLDAYRKDHKLASFLAELAGGTLLFGALGAGRTAAQQAAIGAATGALSGAGYSHGDMGDRVRGAKAGGVVGGLFSGAVAPVASRLGTAAMDLTKRPATNSFMNIIDSIKQRGDEMVIDAMQKDATSPAAIAAARAALPANTPVSAIELAGENTLGLLRGAATVPGVGKNTITETLENRAEGFGGRILNDLEDRLGTTMPDGLDKVEELVALRKANAATSYPGAYTHSTSSDQIKALLATPDFARAYADLRQSLRLQGENIPKLFSVQTNPATGKKMVVLTEKDIPVKIIDYVKQASDDYIDKQFRAGKIGRTRAVALRKRMNDVLDIIDTEVPDYANARKMYAGDSQMIHALDAGRGAVGENARVVGQALPQFLKDDQRLVKKTVDKMRADGRTGELEMYAVGAFDQLRQKLKEFSTPASAAQWLRKPETREYIAAILPDKASAARFTQMLDKETKIARIGSRIPTLAAAKLEQEQKQLAQDALELFLSTIALNPARAAGFAVGGMVRRMRGITEETANQISKRLLAGAQNPFDLQNAMKELEVTAKTLEERSKRRAAIRAGSSAALSGEVVR